MIFWIINLKLWFSSIVWYDKCLLSPTNSNVVSFRWKNLKWLKFEEKHLQPFCVSLSSTTLKKRNFFFKLSLKTYFRFDITQSNILSKIFMLQIHKKPKSFQMRRHTYDMRTSCAVVELGSLRIRNLAYGFWWLATKHIQVNGANGFICVKNLQHIFPLSCMFFSRLWWCCRYCRLEYDITNAGTGWLLDMQDGYNT